MLYDVVLGFSLVLFVSSLFNKVISLHFCVVCFPCLLLVVLFLFVVLF